MVPNDWVDASFSGFQQRLNMCHVSSLVGVLCPPAVTATSSGTTYHGKKKKKIADESKLMFINVNISKSVVVVRMQIGGDEMLETHHHH